MDSSAEYEWPVKLFNRSVKKQRKFKELVRMLGDTRQLDCLDIGSDNGVISYLLRQRGGNWTSADLDEQSVRAIEKLVHTNVFQIDGGQTPFQTSQFDRVAIVDFLEHIPDDAGFIAETYRILKPGGWLIINVPHALPSLLRRFRHLIGQTDEKHGHLRPGYTLQSLRRLLGKNFTVQAHSAYSRFFSELVDTLIVFAVSLAQKNKKEKSRKGQLVTGDDLSQNRSMFKIYSLIYPVVWLFSQLDKLLFFTSGYMLIVKTQVNKQPGELVFSGNGKESTFDGAPNLINNGKQGG